MLVSSLRFGRPAGVGLLVLLTLATGSAAQETPAGPDERFEGTWQANKEMSQDWALKIALSAGPDQLKGRVGRDKLLPSGGGEGEMRRFRLRQRLVAASEAILTLIEKTDDGTNYSETYSYDAANDRLALLLRVDNKQLNGPSMVRTVFDRIPQ